MYNDYVELLIKHSNSKSNVHRLVSFPEVSIPLHRVEHELYFFS
jgi:hypothetical protein